MKLFKKDYSAISDENLMQQFQEGNNNAFKELYSRYENYVLNFFYGKLWSDREKAEDFTHDLFTKIIKNPDAFDTSRKFKTWLFSVANNMCKNEYKKQSVRHEGSQSMPEDKEFAGNVQAADDLVDKKNFAEALKEELDKLGEKHRVVFEMRHFDGLALNEIAEILEINTGTVKSRLHHATKHLADKLAVFKKTIAG